MNEVDTVGLSPTDAQFFGWKRWGVGTLAILGAMSAPSILNREPHLPYTLAFFAVNIPLVTFCLSLSQRWVTRRRLGSWLALVTSLLVAAAAGAAGSFALFVVANNLPVLGVEAQRAQPYSIAPVMGAGFGVIICAMWALAIVFPFAAEDARLRALETEKLKLEADQLRAAAELTHLRSQIEPHFLLNTLNAIAGLVTQDPSEARRLLACLGDLLRDALRDAEEIQSLNDEIAWLRLYADILESRHAGSLRFQWEIDRAAEKVLLPRLLLQPLVENAVKHGALRRRDGKGTVLVRAVVTPMDGKSPARLVCSVEDNGPGIPTNAPRSGALGLHVVRRRLALKYPDATLHIESSPEGTRSVVELPGFSSNEQPRTEALVEVAQ